MAKDPVQNCSMDLRGERLSQKTSDGRFVRVVVGADETVSAVDAGRALFVYPIVLPVSATLMGLSLEVKASGPVELSVAGKDLTVGSSEGSTRAEWTGQQLGLPVPFELAEVGYSDFVQHVLEITVDAPADSQATVNLTGRVDYSLPLESAAAYLTYVMTQA